MPSFLPQNSNKKNQMFSGPWLVRRDHQESQGFRADTTILASSFTKYGL